MNTKLPCTKYLMALIMQVNILLNEVIDNSPLGRQNDWPHYIWIK